MGTDKVHIVDIGKRTKGRRASIARILLPLLWPEGKALSKEKINDLKDLLSLIPKDAKPFFNFLKTQPSAEFVDDVDGFGEGLDFELEDE